MVSVLVANYCVLMTDITTGRRTADGGTVNPWDEIAVVERFFRGRVVQIETG